MTDATLLLRAIDFAADRHRNQRRKGIEASPYINHPIRVASVLAEIGGVTDLTTLVAAVLHDTVEDTTVTSAELEREFGSAVAAVVNEVSDDKDLPKDERKRQQIAHAAQLSTQARLVKLADKLVNITDLTQSPPADWSRERISDYLNWARCIVNEIRGTNPALEAQFDAQLGAASNS